MVVLLSPGAPVRCRPELRAPIVGYHAAGEVVSAIASCGRWLELRCASRLAPAPLDVEQADSGGGGGGGSGGGRRGGGPGPPARQWVLMDGAVVGQPSSLLWPLRSDDCMLFGKGSRECPERQRARALVGGRSRYGVGGVRGSGLGAVGGGETGAPSTPALERYRLSTAARMYARTAAHPAQLPRMTADEPLGEGSWTVESPRWSTTRPEGQQLRIDELLALLEIASVPPTCMVRLPT